MIFPFIPFLLETLVYVENHTEWSFGPEYTFKLNRTAKVFKETFLPEEIIATVKCRPKVSFQSVQNVLFCHLQNMTFSNMSREAYKHITETGIWPSSVQTESHEMPDQFFEIEFGMRGVHSFKVNKFTRSDEPFYIVPDIVELFDVDVNSSIMAENVMKDYEDAINANLEHTISFFKQNEDTIKASECDTLSRIGYILSNHTYENREFQDQQNKTKFDFYLRLISHTKSIDQYVLIRRYRKNCLYLPYFVFANKLWEIMHRPEPNEYLNEMEIRSRNPKFKSYTLSEGYVLFSPTDNKHYFSEDMYIELLHIKPAQYELDTTKYEYRTILKSGMNGQIRN